MYNNSVTAALNIKLALSLITGLTNCWSQHV